MTVQQSPLARLQRHARERALDTAVIEQRGTEWAKLTWNELYRRVIDGAAGMIEAGVDPGQVVVIRVPTGIRQLELEFATRVAGAVPLLLPEHLDQGEVGRLLDAIEVRLVVVDDAERPSTAPGGRRRDAASSWQGLRSDGRPPAACPRTRRETGGPAWGRREAA